MTTPELIDFIKKNLILGISKEEISSKLKAQGWEEVDILEAFNIINPEKINNVDTEIKDVASPDSLGASVQNINTINNYAPVNTKKRKVIKFLIVVVLFLILSLGFFVIYAFGYLTSQNKIFSNLFESSNENTSVAYDFNLKIDFSKMKIEDTELLDMGKSKVINFNSKGAVDFSDEENAKFFTNFSSGFEETMLGVDMRMINKSLYISMTKAPDLGFFTLKPFENKWVVIKQDDSSDLATNPLLASSPLGMYSSNKLTDEQTEKIMGLVKDAKFVKITKRNLPQMIDGDLSYHFNFELDKEGIISFIKELQSYISSIEGTEISDIPEISDEDFNKAFSRINNFDGEIWVGIFTHLPYKISMNFDLIDPDNLSDGSSSISSEISYHDWNKPVVVEVPNGAVPIEELIKTIFGGMFGASQEVSTNLNNDINDVTFDISDPLALDAARIKSSDATIKSIHSNMIAQAELYYDNNKMSYKGFCRDKGNFGAYQLAIELPSGTIYKCNDSVSAWASWSKLSDGEYFCVDSVGTSFPYKTLPTGVSCHK